MCVHVVRFGSFIHEVDFNEVANFGPESGSQYRQMGLIVASLFLVFEASIFIFPVDNFSVGSTNPGFVSKEEYRSVPVKCANKKKKSVNAKMVKLQFNNTFLSYFNSTSNSS